MTSQNTKIDISVKDVNSAKEWIEGVVRICDTTNKPADLKIIMGKTAINIPVSPGDETKNILSFFLEKLESIVPGNYATSLSTISSPAQNQAKTL